MMPGNKSAAAKLAMVADDSRSIQALLATMLKEEGYEVICAGDGLEAVEQFERHQPDLVLMDVNMPVMDGWEATRRIKAMSRARLVPVIFVTKMNDDEAIVKCLDVGGDDILPRPFSSAVFKAKIMAIQRTNDLYQELRGLHLAQQRDEELAEQLFSEVIESGNVALEYLGIVKRAATTFSGDVQLTALAPNGDLNVLLGDFTGHGLGSTIGAVPMAETFRVMTHKGFTPAEIIAQINRKLYDLLPSNIFLAAAMVTLPANENVAYLWNGGLPDVLVFDGKQGELKSRVRSQHPPLGIMADLLPDQRAEVVKLAPTDHILLFSDGIIEARSPGGEMFGEQRLLDASGDGLRQQALTGRLMAVLDDFCQKMPQEDDISLVDIPGDIHARMARHLPPTASSAEEAAGAEFETRAITEKPCQWQWQLSLSGSQLAKTNPVPMAMNQIQEMEGSGDYTQHLFTVLTELYVNALDHGILGLSSELKDSPDGFRLYFEAREARLSQLADGRISLRLCFHPTENGGVFNIHIEDSGRGFDSSKWLAPERQQQLPGDRLSGRGIMLVQQLCESLEYRQEGRVVDARFVWQR